MTRAALLDLFRRHREKATGHWKLGQEPARTVFFDSGDIVFAHSTFPSDRLTHLLVERGKLTQAQLDYALANLRTGISIGKNLIEMGFITQRDLLDVARAQVERVVCGALATADETPSFDAKELDPTIVRLPFDTPELLLNGLLGLKDREGLLELLGPLNQVVVLQGRRLMEMALPADLAKIPSLLDGSHTLLELSREAMTEPIRLGTFALFLREMGWARLHEMPPMDRGALDLALAGEPEALSVSLPDSPLETVPSLFSTISAAAKPTTNLEHLSQALDELPESSIAEEPEFQVETGQAYFPAPEAEPLERPQAEPAAPELEPEPAVLILPSTLETPQEEPAPPAPDLESNLPARSRLPWLLLLVLIVLAGAGFGWKQLRGRRVPQVHPEAPQAQPVPEPRKDPLPEPKPEPPATPPPATPVKAEPAKAEPEPTPRKDIGLKPEDRVAALRRRDLDLALAQGQRLAAQLPRERWTLRLEIACQVDTLVRAVDFFGTPAPDLWILPLTFKDGRQCYQVFHGSYPTRAAAEAAVRNLPAVFRSEGNRPKPFNVGEILTRL